MGWHCPGNGTLRWICSFVLISCGFSRFSDYDILVMKIALFILDITHFFIDLLGTGSMYTAGLSFISVCKTVSL